MRAYVQKHHGEFANINTLTAFLGFRDIGYDVRFLSLRRLIVSNSALTHPLQAAFLSCWQLLPAWAL
jgi:hypothetical protein